MIGYPEKVEAERLGVACLAGQIIGVEGLEAMDDPEAEPLSGYRADGASPVAW
jgi:hypothetical protein